MTTKQQLRLKMRKIRQSLSLTGQHQAAELFKKQLINSKALNSAKHIALYLPHDGEINLTPTLHWLWQQHKQCYLPIVPTTGKILTFGHYAKNTTLTANRYGINEPVTEHILRPSQLDAVLLPLVAFDNVGNRLGMGGGYYDTSFAKLTDQVTLIGCAHHAQQLEALPIDSWDLPVHAIVTDQCFYIF
ncbi:putative 5-formyltetrahydrofolate cyclo-ligase [Piscirickettsia salmonis]|uniref:5-formyltetrahydrofolate cyclo-ligase n=1 Tax=Piscirickettsia salmonis TaxID=1238 RepID=UPI0012B94F99|nr:5-formyltetrahydrofolate cyclo-ligase [Piscirickettsia salmonis]QGP51639.1 putative 5-formyltetrahydrofolate cyclo-ligase [Piscirickettsia salmonis]QGP53148.1 putative 5-formyltetrahydrofolate cyclo-ligase [Piscirickettsia salmonis]QGP60915.1 putative 5-formyltetrahydrofolate cyclo-ligase [Piscirickettsia salmonis]QGP62717.1 putative 5-formyltetrahydrofolate cyclo-ligase [Piscirickettsia salmonis]